MLKFRCLKLGAALTCGGLLLGSVALARTEPPNPQMPPAPFPLALGEGGELLTQASRPVFGYPRYSYGPGGSRVVFDLRPGVSYRLLPTEGGLFVELSGARVAVSAQKALGGSGLTYAAGPTWATIGTRSPLRAGGPGWRATETTVQGGGRVLILEFGGQASGGDQTRSAAPPPPAPSSPAPAPAAPVAQAPAPKPPVQNPPAPKPASPAPAPKPATPNPAGAQPAGAKPASAKPANESAPLEDGREANVVGAGGRLSDLQPTPAPRPLPKPVVPTVPGDPGSGLSGKATGRGDGREALGAPRMGKNPGLTRLVLDLPPGAAYRIAPVGRELRVELTGVSVSARSAKTDGEVAAWSLAPSPTGATFSVRTPHLLSPVSGWSGLLLPPEKGARLTRLVLDFSPALANTRPLLSSERRLGRVPAAAAGRGVALLSVAGNLGRPRVVLDPGHGGKDPGAVGSVIEKQVTLDVALRVRELLEGAGVDVLLTREQDTQLHPDKQTDLRLRSEMARNAQLFVSIHANATPPSKVLTRYGIETWWNPNHPASRRFAGLLQEGMVNWSGGYDRGLKNSQSLGVLRRNPVPAALVEIGFTSHPVDGLNLKNTHYLDRVALGIATGIHRALMGGL